MTLEVWERLDILYIISLNQEYVHRVNLIESTLKCLNKKKVLPKGAGVVVVVVVVVSSSRTKGKLSKCPIIEVGTTATNEGGG